MKRQSGLSLFLARRDVMWTLLAIPAAVILWWRAHDAISYGETIILSGQWSVGLLCAALLATPINHLLPKRAIARLLMRHRRAIGVASFGYALVHTAIYLNKKWQAGLVIKEAQDPSLLTGWLAVVIFLVLAVTSNNVSVRKLGKRWKTLHRLIYVAAALIFGHWALTNIDPATAIGVFVGMCLIELVRLKR